MSKSQPQPGNWLQHHRNSRDLMAFCPAKDKLSASVYEMDAGGVYRGCPPLLLGLSGRRIVGGEQLDGGSGRQSHRRIKRSKEVRGGEGCSDHD
jgi:hypothetical protein